MNSKRSARQKEEDTDEIELAHLEAIAKENVRLTGQHGIPVYDEAGPIYPPPHVKDHEQIKYFHEQRDRNKTKTVKRLKRYRKMTASEAMGSVYDWLEEKPVKAIGRLLVYGITMIVMTLIGTQAGYLSDIRESSKQTKDAISHLSISVNSVKSDVRAVRLAMFTKDDFKYVYDILKRENKVINELTDHEIERIFDRSMLKSLIEEKKKENKP